MQMTAPAHVGNALCGEAVLKQRYSFKAFMRQREVNDKLYTC